MKRIAVAANREQPPNEIRLDRACRDLNPLLDEPGLRAGSWHRKHLLEVWAGTKGVGVRYRLESQAREQEFLRVLQPGQLF